MNLSGYGRLLSTALISTALLTACGADEAKQAETLTTTKAATTTSEKPENTLAVVNGKAITMDDLTFFLQARQEAAPMEATSPEAVLNELINRELLLTEAEKQGIAQQPEIQKQLEIQRASLLVNKLLSDQLAKADTSEEALKKEYDAQVAELDLSEYKASHILLKTEDDAKAVIEELAKGGNFADVAKEKSTGPSGPNGGDLGWFQAGSMVPEFGSAIASMKKGDVSKTPVKTDFGWHVIYLEDTRTKEPPKFEDVTQQLETIVANKQVESYLENLRNNGKVELMKPEPQEAAATSVETESSK